ncbi:MULTISPECIES: CDP-diacylglycerol--glycerol-3-phosphate 3-phosphatidyltransferase [Streptomyces]|uniref:CDP-diacylglycerol--glycerol-3-phosphate 3-phosphatidyltransferase n=1 Tax=Streptomyces griseus TaxID=1911 RepID=A0A380P3D1_STRGR|nr:MULTISPECIES: CDP-diacylglycerol--glycerol-3-phosphate 3-phosphatidyltransferase [Streptomyces]WSU35343.1 CDP-diacylglycerol--glycerol-3-phosphate 3-phosphatidyltransferase [Streptomyces gougerotii]MBL3804069.1 CDP-diacylglycerol--glycerol-3-phosphate 3-phosphatidyltransferase [Streptomyces sp. BRB081]MDQ0292827.1 CDP-diacylglycerol--glycerol-3-phosphate 3-phosphatidyltransferase [Streptomyces sp. DSM 41037]RPK86605.1 putative CDP-diacylglycerol--glycerol-3-phosphate 3-phosphatidyl-transfera
MTGVPASTAGGAHAAGGVRGGRRGTPAVRQAGVWNIANILTMIRLLLVPGFVALLLADGGYDPAWRALAWAAFAVAMITDIFDGHLARTYDLVTDFGKIADPIADKAIMGAALICLSWLGELPWWVTAVILGRELGITLLRFWVIRFGVIPASRGGKLKTLAQGTAAGMYVLALTGPLATLRFWVMALAVVLTVATGLDYVRQAVVLRRAGLAAERAARLEAAADPAARESTLGEVGPAVPTATASEALVATAASAAGPQGRSAEKPAAAEPAGREQEKGQDATGVRQSGRETRR